MREMPPEEEQLEQSEKQQPRRTSALRHESEVPRLRKRHKEFYSDEHPEVPKVKRASRLQEDAPSATSKTHKSSPPDGATARSSQRARLAPPEKSMSLLPSSTRLTRTEKTSVPPASAPQPTPKQQAIQRSSSTAGLTPPEHKNSHDPEDPNAHVAEEALDADDELKDKLMVGSTGTRKIVVSPRRRSSNVYQPSPALSYRTNSRPQARTLLNRWQNFSHNKPLIIIVLSILMIALFLPLIGNIVTSNLHQTTTITTQGGNNSSQATADPHNIIITPVNSDHPAPPVYATSAYLLDADTGATLYAHNPFMHLPMLSTTKLMTAVLSIEHGQANQKITITPAIANDINRLSADSSLMGIKSGETYTLQDLLYGLLLVSGNDAATAIADGLGGNVPTFATMMNGRAQQLGMYDTHYMNPHGLLQDGHYSSAHDLAVIGRISMNIPLLQQTSASKAFHIPATADHAEHFFINNNQFLWWYPGVNGGKPGWDGDTNFIQVVSCIHNNHHLIGITMHTKDWWTDMRDLMNWGFDSFQWISPYDVDLLHPIPFDTSWHYFVQDKKENTIPTANHGRYYIYTGYSVSPPFLNYFDQNKGLQNFGYPLSLPKLAAGTTFSQKFEHATIQCDTSTNQCTTQ